MTLPEPFKIVIPSIADDVSLTCRVYASPPHPSQATPLSWNGAVVAHPYATLGGDFNDPVVLLVAEELYDVGYMVITFNFRGATTERRAGSSWTSKPERADYVSVVYFLMQLMISTKPHSVERLKTVMAGYSYGSMIASSMPPALEVVNAMNSSNSKKPIENTAQHLAATLADENSVPLAQSSVDSQSQSFETAYLLVSPILPPVTSFLTLFSGGNGAQYLETHKTLAIYGTEDHFTSCKKLRRWTSKLGIQAKEADGGGHFWQDLTAVRILRHAISDWAS